MQNFLGQDGFVWWIGVVEDIADTETLGRCKVRIFGYHDDASKILTEDLPWATAIHSTNTSRFYSSLILGDWVFGFFLDATNAQEPAILGVIPTRATPRSFNRVNTNGNSANTTIVEQGNNYIEMIDGGDISIHHSSGAEIKISSTGAINISSNTSISFTAPTISFADSSVTLTPTSIAQGLAEGLVNPAPPA